MTDPQAPPHPDLPPATPGERRLDRPPSDRYRAAGEAGSPTTQLATAPTSQADERPSPARGIAFGAMAAALGALALALLGGPAAISAGLLVVAAVNGYVVGLVTVIGAGETLARPVRPWIAATLAGLGTLLGQMGLWLFARAAGGVLAPLDYLGQTFGPLVLLELSLAVAVAWWRAR